MRKKEKRVPVKALTLIDMAGKADDSLQSGLTNLPDNIIFNYFPIT